MDNNLTDAANTESAVRRNPGSKLEASLSDEAVMLLRRLERNVAEWHLPRPRWADVYKSHRYP